MSLFGALSSGVSGLIAQSSAMGAISDNITNVSTIGYKNTRVDFQTLVTKQTSSTLFSPGGVQSKPRTDTGVQGLLQSSTSSTDLSLSGQGFFIVNEANTPTISDQFLYTRAGSFFQDNEGFLRNTAGFYLQAWPTDAGGKVVPTKTASTTIANQNIVSTDFLTTVNLSRVGGTATSTSTIGIGANLPANDVTGTTHTTDVQFFDSLGNAANMSFVHTKSGTPNEWKLNVDPPTGTTHITLEDAVLSPKVYRSIGQLEFNQKDALGAARRPADQSSTTINGKKYIFDTNNSVTDAVAQIETITIGGTVDTGDIFRATFTTPAATVNYTVLATDTTTAEIAAGFAAAINADTIVVNGITYTFTTGQAEDATGADTVIFRDGPLDRVLADLRFAIAANDLEFDTSAIRLRGTGSPNNDTLVIDSKANGSTFTISVAGLTTNPTEPDGTSGFISLNLITVQTEPAISFTSSGLPNVFNIAELDIRNFSNGAANFDDDANNVKQITIDFGTLGEANGMTQFGAAFTPVFINQNGSRFGTFAGLTVNANGLMTALFDNGETRPIFQIPVATFVNVNGLESKSGNVFNATEGSGDSTLRVADNGPAGQTVQGALEASTVDIGEEFTKMIVVQRAFSASAKIISTADDMLEELLRTKR